MKVITRNDGKAFEVPTEYEDLIIPKFATWCNAEEKICRVNPVLIGIMSADSKYNENHLLWEVPNNAYDYCVEMEDGIETVYYIFDNVDLASELATPLGTLKGWKELNASKE